MSEYQISYGTVSFPYKNLSVTSTIIYEEDKATVLGTAYGFQVAGWVTAPDTASFGILIEKLKCQLHTPRLAFLVQWNDGSGWTTLYNFDSTTDILYGPNPTSVNITEFRGGRAALVTFDLRVDVKECHNGSCGTMARPSEVLAFTRRFMHVVDQDGFTKRTVAGKLTITSKAAIAGTTPDAYRNFVAPDVPTNFHREAQLFDTAVDGLTMTYSVTDTEYYTVLPRPMTSGHATWTVSQREYGTLIDYTLEGKFSATGSISKIVLLNRIGQLVATKFPLDKVSTNALIFYSKDISADLFKENSLSFRITAMGTAGLKHGNPDVFDFSTGDETFYKRPPVEENGQPVDGIAFCPQPYGGDALNTSGVIAMPMWLYDACANQNPGTSENRPPNNDSPGSTNTPKGDPSSPGTADKPTPAGGTGTKDTFGITAAHAKAPWVDYHEIYSWEWEPHVATFNPKNPNSDPVIFKTAPTTVVFIQSGYGVRIASDPNDVPVPPDPLYTGKQAWMLPGTRISPAVGTPIGDGAYTEYKISWQYVMRLSKRVTAGFTSDYMPMFPNDPRVEAKPPQIPKLPTDFLTQ